MIEDTNASIALLAAKCKAVLEEMVDSEEDFDPAKARWATSTVNVLRHCLPQEAAPIPGRTLAPIQVPHDQPQHVPDESAPKLEDLRELAGRLGSAARHVS